jgi:hypothetical protein
MTTALPAKVSLSRNEDLRLAFELVDEAGAAVAIPSGTWSFVLKSRADEVVVALTPRVGVTNIFDAAVLLSALETSMPVGRLFTGDLKRVDGGASTVWASVSVVRENVVQETEDLGARIVQVTRTAGVTVSVALSAGTALAQAQAAATAAAQDAADAAQILAQVEDIIAPNTLIWGANLVTWG